MNRLDTTSASAAERDTARIDAVKLAETLGRAKSIDPILEVQFDTFRDVVSDPHGAQQAIEHALYLIRDLAAACIAQSAELAQMTSLASDLTDGFAARGVELDRLRTELAELRAALGDAQEANRWAYVTAAFEDRHDDLKVADDRLRTELAATIANRVLDAEVHAQNAAAKIVLVEALEAARVRDAEARVHIERLVDRARSYRNIQDARAWLAGKAVTV